LEFKLFKKTDYLTWYIIKAADTPTFKESIILKGYFPMSNLLSLGGIVTLKFA
jgi:hypothetical protein